MKRYLRTVTKKHKTEFEHSMNIPANVVRKLELSGCIVEITIKEDYFIVKKIGEKLDNSDSLKDEDPYTTIHY